MKVYCCLILCFITLGAAVLLKRTPFERVIPADRLRDFPGTCFAATLCRNVKPGESWALTPFCGLSTCTPFLDKNNKTFLAERVTDCGPLVDLEKTKGCTLLKEKTNETAIFPECCPAYDCEEGTEVVYIKKAAAKKDTREPKQESAKEE